MNLVAREINTARSSIVVSLSFLAANVFGGLLALLMAVIVGEGPEVDGFLAAYSAYLIFTLFGANLRVALVPVLGGTADEDAFRERARVAVRRLAAAGAVMCLVLAACSPLLGRALVPRATDAAQTAAVTTVAILALAAWAQIWSAALSAVLAAAQRFVISAMLYAAGGFTTVLLATLLMGSLGVTGAAIGLAGSALALLAAHAVYLRRFRFGGSPLWRGLGHRATWHLVAVAAAGGAAPLAFQLCQSIALAGVSAVTGAVTAYSYGYLLAVLLSSVTSATLGFTTMPQLVNALESGDGTEGYVERIAAFSLFLFLAPAAAYAALGRPLLDALLEGPLSPSTVDLLWDLSRIFLVMALGWALLAAATPLALAHRRFRVLALASVAIVPLTAAAVVAVHTDGARTVAIVHAACAVTLPLLTLFGLYKAKTAAMVWHASRAGAPALLLALVFPALALVGFDDSVPGSLAGIALGGLLYVALAIKLWPSVGGAALQMLRRPTSAV